MGGGFFIGLASYSYAANFSEYGFVGTGAMAPFTAASIISIKFGLAIFYRVTTGRWLKERDSALVTDRPVRKLKWTNLMPVLG